MVDCYYLPISTADGVRVPRAYASVIDAILRRIRDNGNFVEGKPICVPQGYFEVILRPGKRSGLGTRHGRVRIRFSYSNLYLEAFKSHGMWYRFSNTSPQVIPVGEPVTALPFESGYQVGGLAANFVTLRFGRETMIDIYKNLGSYPNSQDMDKLKIVLAKGCVMFPLSRSDQIRRLAPLHDLSGQWNGVKHSL
ncbi:hypothetical protein ACP4OV_029836 [Aristida adscensionis]